MKTRKNYYQVHLNKKPKTVKRYERKLKRKINCNSKVSHSMDSLSRALLSLNRLFKKGSTAFKKVNAVMGIDLGGAEYSVKSFVKTDEKGNLFIVHHELSRTHADSHKDIHETGCMAIIDEQPEIIMRKDGSVFELGKKTQRGKITGQHAYLLPVWNPELYPMPTNVEAVQDIKRSLNNLGFKKDI